MRLRLPIVAMIAVGLGLPLVRTGIAFAVPTPVVFADAPTCDPLFVPPNVHELGIAPAFAPFPTELIDAVATFTQEPACPLSDDPGIPNAVIVMTNLTGIAWRDVWYVADPLVPGVGGTSISNVDGLVDMAPVFVAPGESFLIDAVGMNRPLIFESMVADGIFRPVRSGTSSFRIMSTRWGCRRSSSIRSVSPADRSAPPRREASLQCRFPSRQRARCWRERECCSRPFDDAIIDDASRGRLHVRFRRQKRAGRVVYHRRRDARHAAVIERAGLLLARAAENGDGNLSFLAEVDLRPLRVRRPEDGDDRHVKRGRDVPRAGVVGHHQVAAADDLLERAQRTARARRDRPAA